MGKKLIVVVPGFANREKDECLNKLIEGLVWFAARRGSTMQMVETPDSHDIKEYIYEDEEGKKESFFFKEAFWNDLAHPLSEKQPFSNVAI